MFNSGSLLRNLFNMAGIALTMRMLAGAARMFMGVARRRRGPTPEP